MAVHRKYGCGIKDLAGRHRRLIKKQPAPVRLVCTQVVDAQLTHTAGQILQILRTVAVYGILSHCINAFFLPPCQSHADGHFLVFKHALNGHIRFNVIHLEDVLAVVLRKWHRRPARILRRGIVRRYRPPRRPQSAIRLRARFRQPSASRVWRNECRGRSPRRRPAPAVRPYWAPVSYRC